jgi:23S rRNA (cytosine1962-C5)-methyltransferase
MPAPSPSTVVVTRRGSERLTAGHSWIYRSDVAQEPGLSGGEIVRIVDGRGWFRGFACYSSKSQIALRMLSREDVECDRAFFLARLEAAKAFRERAFPGEVAWRAVHGEADLLPGLVVDRYGEWLSVQLLIQATEARREMLTGLLAEVFAPKGIVERSDAKVRALEGLAPRKGVLVGEAPERLEYREGEVRLRVDLLGGQKTGAFLDQRENRLATRQWARGRGLDCFSYSGAFALQLARGCESVTAVEVSDQAGGLIDENARLNGLTNLTVAVQNAFDFLKAGVDAGERYDVIVLDPPAFAKSKAAVAAAERGYKEINLRGLQLLSPGGCLVTASCSYHIDEADFERILASAAADAKREVQIVERRGAGRDHPVLMGLRETRYLKCFVLRVL